MTRVEGRGMEHHKHVLTAGSIGVCSVFSVQSSDGTDYYCNGTDTPVSLDNTASAASTLG